MRLPPALLDSAQLKTVAFKLVSLIQFSAHRSSQRCHSKLQIEKDEGQNHLVRCRPHDADVGNGVQEPLGIDGDVVGDLTCRVLGSSPGANVIKFFSFVTDDKAT